IDKNISRALEIDVQQGLGMRIVKGFSGLINAIKAAPLQVGEITGELLLGLVAGQRIQDVKPCFGGPFKHAVGNLIDCISLNGVSAVPANRYTDTREQQPQVV